MTSSNIDKAHRNLLEQRIVIAPRRCRQPNGFRFVEACLLSSHKINSKHPPIGYQEFSPQSQRSGTRNALQSRILSVDISKWLDDKLSMIRSYQLILDDSRIFTESQFGRFFAKFRNSGNRSIFMVVVFRIQFIFGQSHRWKDVRFTVVVAICTDTEINFTRIGVFFKCFGDS